MEKGISMRKLALHADMEYSQLSKIERGVTNPQYHPYKLG
jgi:transcriptional regulator with XRE-family HTH domain